jgi:nicotinate-nucleotide adenylyltransferase
MGGTFDPPHYGHLFIAEEARVRCALETVLWMPSNVPAHREGKSAAATGVVRAALAQAAIADNDAFTLSRLELERPGPSYLYDTLCELRQIYPEAELFFICGTDSLRDVLTWYRGAELFELCTFVAVSRPGVALDTARAQLPEALRARVIALETPGLHIASRELRARVAENLPIRYLVPDAVEREIKARGLYHTDYA